VRQVVSMARRPRHTRSTSVISTIVTSRRYIQGLPPRAKARDLRRIPRGQTRGKILKTRSSEGEMFERFLTPAPKGLKLTFFALGTCAGILRDRGDRFSAAREATGGVPCS